TDVEDDRVTLETTPGTEVVFLKVALAKLIEPLDEADEADDEQNVIEAEDSTDDAEYDAQDAGSAVENDEHSGTAAEQTTQSADDTTDADRPMAGNATSAVEHDGDDSEQNKQNCSQARIRAPTARKKPVATPQRRVRPRRPLI